MRRARWSVEAASIVAAEDEDRYGAAQLPRLFGAALLWLEPYAAGKLPHEQIVDGALSPDPARRTQTHADTR